MTSFSRIRNGWTRRLAPWAALVWLAVALTPCICAMAQVQSVPVQTMRVTDAYHEACQDSVGGVSEADRSCCIGNCCTGSTVQSVVDASERIKVSEILPTSELAEPGLYPAVLPSQRLHAYSDRDRERAPPVYLVTRRLRV